MKNNRSLPIIVLLLFVIHVANAQLEISNKDEIVGVSLERLERYDAFLASHVNTGKIPGAISLIKRKGEIVHHATYGFKSLAEKTKMGHDGIFHIMSMTKPIVTVAFMMLYEEGHFQLNDPVSKYLPQFKDIKVAKDVNSGLDGPTEPAKTEITLAQLLSHTAGFSHGLGGTELDNATSKALYFEPQETIESRVNTLVSIPMVGHPGEQWYYSASPDVLSLLIEKFSGMSTAEFLQQRLFDPLEMDDTGYNIPKGKQDRWTPVHNFNEEGKMVNSKQQLPVEGNTVYGGTHGLFSSAANYMNFCEMLLNKGQWKGKQFLSPKTIEIMTMNQVGDLYQAPGQGFGFGFGVTTDVAESKSLGSVGQYYWSGAYCTYFFIDPEEELIAILMTQVQPYNNFYGEMMRQYIYQSLID